MLGAQVGTGRRRAPSGSGGSSACSAESWLGDPSLAAWPSIIPSLSPEPNNDAHIRSPSRPCSPVHLHEGHAKLSSSPPRASPVRMGPSYVLKKGAASGWGGDGAVAPRPGWSSWEVSGGTRTRFIKTRPTSWQGPRTHAVPQPGGQGRCPLSCAASPAQVTGSRRRKEQRYRSVVSDIFDGSVLSLVQCLTCDRVGGLPLPGGGCLPEGVGLGR